MIATMITVTLTAFNRQLSGIRSEMAMGFAGMQTTMNVRFEAVDRRFDGVDRRLDRLEKKVAGLHGDVTVLTRRMMGE